MKLATLAPLAIALASTTFAWIVNDYADVTDCNIINTNAVFRSYEGTDSNACHNFGAGESGSTCSQHTMEVEENCTDDLLISGSVLVRDSPQCEFFTASDCAGSARVIASGNCLTGEYASFSCVSELLLESVSR
ncbi:uncharacterized protein N7484_007086 [Penicillium longicatenatum]|uniref:uncharacterized protein n=1 Tax=Penicillium longicatenatum TaxID=1561947 RepID=UPI002547A5A6|nr:uncharacterized protein N7484_007086 [Penicillium longicatenatum]KAJ5639224.1 hypothetical protein N7484_007086 [Penicillium longicatenatum]